MPDNTFSDDESPHPMPRDYMGGGNKPFGVLRNIDGHLSLTNDRQIPEDAENCHEPVGMMDEGEGSDPY